MNLPNPADKEAFYAWANLNCFTFKQAEEVRAFYAEGFRAGMERAAQICERLDREDTTCQGDFTDLAKFADAIRAETVSDGIQRKV